MTSVGPEHLDYGSEAQQQGTEDTAADMAEDRADGDQVVSAPVSASDAFALDAAQMTSTDGQSKAGTTGLK